MYFCTLYHIPLLPLLLLLLLLLLLSLLLLHPGCSPFRALALLDLGKARLHQAEQNSDKRPPPAAFNAERREKREEEERPSQK